LIFCSVSSHTRGCHETSGGGDDFEEDCNDNDNDMIISAVWFSLITRCHDTCVIEVLISLHIFLSTFLFVFHFVFSSFSSLLAWICCWALLSNFRINFLLFLNFIFQNFFRFCFKCFCWGDMLALIWGGQSLIFQFVPFFRVV